MISKILRKNKHLKINKKLLIMLVTNMDIPESDKAIFIKTINNTNNSKIEGLYQQITSFIKNNEIRYIEDIEKNNFTKIAGMTHKEALKKKTELNSMSFLLRNV